jgi:hypothetical protein
LHFIVKNIFLIISIDVIGLIIFLYYSILHLYVSGIGLISAILEDCVLDREKVGKRRGLLVYIVCCTINYIFNMCKNSIYVQKVNLILIFFNKNIYFTSWMKIRAPLFYTIFFLSQILYDIIENSLTQY